MAHPHLVHATGLVLGGRGVLIRGASGAGKSLLALELIEDFSRAGEEALLVADDGVELLMGETGLEMRGPQAIAGLIELRGRGVVHRPFTPRARLDLIVDLVTDLVRLPSEEAFTESLYGLTVARCPVPARGVVDSAHQRLLVHAGLAGLAERDQKIT